MFLKIVKQTMTSKYFCTIRDFKKSSHNGKYGTNDLGLLK